MNEAEELKELTYQLEYINKERELVTKILENYKAKVKIGDKITSLTPELEKLRSEVETLRNAYKNK